MTNRTYVGGLLVVLAAGLTGCDADRRPGPSGPSPVPQSGPPTPTGIHLAGTVSDAAWRPLAAARVEVVNGPQTGLSTTTDAQGNYQLTGTFDDTTRFRATKESHVAATWPLPPICPRCNPQYWLFFYLEALVPHANIAGDYTLTINTAGACATLPDEVRTRTYGATVTAATDSTNSRFDVAVNGSAFLENRSSFTIGMAGDYLAADVGDWGHDYPGLVEQIGANTYLTLGGSVTASVTAGSTISASFHGVVERCELTTEWGSRYSCGSAQVVTHAKCGPTTHQLTLMRR
jgi:hypothetical protein